jgi:hypothetical protein
MVKPGMSLEPSMASFVGPKDAHRIDMNHLTQSNGPSRLIAICALFVALGCSGAADEGDGIESHVRSDDASSVEDRFTCKTTAPFDTAGLLEITFAVRDLDVPARSGIVMPEGDDPIAVEVTPRESRFHMLNENLVFHARDGQLVIKGDADGEFAPRLVLHENSGYRNGYITIDEDVGPFADRPYSTIRCDHAPQPPPLPTSK